VFYPVPAGEERCEPQPRVIAEAANQHQCSDENPGVPREVNPFQIEGAKDTSRRGALQTEKVDLSHLSNVLKKVSGLGHDQDV